MHISNLLLFGINLALVASVFGNNQHRCHLNCDHGHCGTRNSGEHYCHCFAGWQGNHCDIEDKCYHNPCHHGGTCHNIGHKPFFRCECAHNRIGYTCLENHCVSAPCKNGGTCFPKNDHVHELYVCRCPDGFTGKECQDIIPVNVHVHVTTTQTPNPVTHTDACATTPCRHHGRCHPTGQSPFFTCACINAYIGELCQDDHCSSSPCQNNGTCHHSKHDLFYCSCPDGYHGNLCQTYDVMTSSLKPLVNSNHTTVIHSNSQTAKTSDSTTAFPVEYTHASTKGQPSDNILNNLLVISRTIAPLHTCDKYTSVFGVAEKVMAFNQNASTCTSGTHSSPDAYVLEHCDVNSTSSWKQGVRVMDNCDNIPSYTPIAAFENGIFVPESSYSGVFIECFNNNTGIKMIIQRCDENPTIVHVTSGQFNLNPYSYYTII